MTPARDRAECADGRDGVRIDPLADEKVADGRDDPQVSPLNPFPQDLHAARVEGGPSEQRRALRAGRKRLRPDPRRKNDTGPGVVQAP